MDVYGSFATNLAIECSDIDLTIKFSNNNTNDIDLAINKLSEELTNLNRIDTINPILTATVPVIKLVNSLIYI